MDKLKAMANFVRIVDNGSLSAAADASGQSVASVVRSLAALERHLGVRLLNRSTRRMALTDEGAEYLAWSRRMLAEFADIEQRLDAQDGDVRGLLRLTAPVEFGQRYLAPLVNVFLKEHPQVRVELNLNDQIVPLLDERLDLALRIGHLPDSAMVARQIGSTRLRQPRLPEQRPRHRHPVGAGGPRLHPLRRPGPPLVLPPRRERTGRRNHPTPDLQPDPHRQPGLRARPGHHPPAALPGRR